MVETPPTNTFKSLESRHVIVRYYWKTLILSITSDTIKTHWNIKIKCLCLIKFRNEHEFSSNWFTYSINLTTDWWATNKIFLEQNKPTKIKLKRIFYGDVIAVCVLVEIEICSRNKIPINTFVDVVHVCFSPPRSEFLACGSHKTRTESGLYESTCLSYKIIYCWKCILVKSFHQNENIPFVRFSYHFGKLYTELKLFHKISYKTNTFFSFLTVFSWWEFMLPKKGGEEIVW